ncbi:MAG: hypothetical protein JWP97_3022 [Labilithrix sp.]|nr:hypothetical protein [Labilithrix sp.]
MIDFSYPVRSTALLLVLASASFATAACGKSSTPSPAQGSSAAVPGRPLAVAAFKVVWERPGHAAMTDAVAADGTITTDGKPSAKVEGTALKVHDKPELEVAADGTVTGAHGAGMGKFAIDDALVLTHRTKTLRVLDDGKVVTEDADGSNRAPFPAHIEGFTPAIRRTALLDVLFFSSLAPDLRDQLGAAK